MQALNGDMGSSEFHTAISILLETDDFVVINKPDGLVVHPSGKNRAHSSARNTVHSDEENQMDEVTLVDWLLERYPHIRDVGESWETNDGKTIPRPGIVHRLDKDTSGVLVIAKTHDMYAHLKKQFQERHIQKEYRAFVYGVMKQDELIINRPIGKSKKDFRQWSAQRGARGTLRDAYTEVQVLTRGMDHTYVKLLPKTGRTHQLRVHMKAANHPIVCDGLYAPNRTCDLGFERLALHAYSLRFADYAGEMVTVEAPLPADFEHALAVLA